MPELKALAWTGGSQRLAEFSRRILRRGRKEQLRMIRVIQTRSNLPWLIVNRRYLSPAGLGS